MRWSMRKISVTSGSATQDVLLPAGRATRQKMPARDIGHVEQIELFIERGEPAPENSRGQLPSGWA